MAVLAVIVDPGGDEVFTRIRAIDANARVILASRYIEPALKDRLLKLGVTCFVPKPYSPSQVLRAVRSTLEAP
jgi:DNA-binding NarL/FixJ family response regulator